MVQTTGADLMRKSWHGDMTFSYPSELCHKMCSYMTSAAPERPFLSPAQAAELLSVSRFTIYRLCRAGQLPSVRVGGQLRIPRATLVRRLAETRGGWPAERV
jgi:excisionase family DNA binding protein